ncbi:MAG: hypothetical protein ACE5JL_12975 [Dehalococcoidia bacterium]
MGADGLRRTIARLRRSRGGPSRPGKKEVNLLPESAFDAMLDLRLKDLQRQLGEVKSRVNGLFFFVLGAAIVQVALGFVS